MVASSALDKIPLLYHFTDRRNLPSIIQHGGLLSVDTLERMGVIPAAPGGNKWSRDADAMKGMDQYVHLCFRDSHPMEYAARQDGRIESSVFLQINSAVLKFLGVRFTNDVSNKTGVTSIAIADAEDKIDLEVLYTRTDWKDPQIQERLSQAEKCEVLVPHRVPIDLIRNIRDG